MSTRSYVGRKLDNGKIKYIYCHFDGYPDSLGVVLYDHYNTKEKIDELLSFGDASSIHERLHPTDPAHHNIDGDREEGVCCFYGRDRGEKGVDAKTADTLDDLTNDWCISYVYVWDDGKWLVQGGKQQDWTPLQEVLNK